MDHLTGWRQRKVQEEGTSWKDGRHGLGAFQALDLLLADLLQMIHRDGAIFHAHLYTARDGHLIGMDLRPHAIFDARHQDAFSVLTGEEAFVAEHVDEIGQVLGSHQRDHLVDHQIHIVLLMSAVFHGDAMRTQKVRLDGQGRGLLEASDHAQQLQLALGGQAVAALDLDGTCTHAHHLVKAFASHVV